MNKIRFLGWDYRITGLWHQNVSKLFSYNAIVFSNMIGKFVAPATVFPAKAPFFRKYLHPHLTEGFASNSTTSYCFIKSPCKEKGRRTEHPAASMSAGQRGRASTSFFLLLPPQRSHYGKYNHGETSFQFGISAAVVHSLTELSMRAVLFKVWAQLLKKERQLLGCFSSLTAKKTTIPTIIFYLK